MSIAVCPKCQCQLEVKLTFASGPKSSQPQANASSDLGQLLDDCEANDPQGKAAEFVADMREKYGRYGATTRVSEKQLSWLHKIASGEGEEW